MIPFRERNPVKVGAVSLVALVLLVLVAFKADSLPLIGGGDTYYAEFSDSSGIKPNDEVRIAGVRVGKVKSVTLDADHNLVKVEFKIRTSSKFGTETGAEIKVKTLLGAMFLALHPKGPGQLDEGKTIPISRTRSAYDVVQAFTGLAERSQDIDLPQLASSLNVLAEATKDTPEELQSTLKGLSALSANVAARDDQIRTLLANLRKVSGVLSQRDQDIVQLMKDSDVLLRAVVARREAVHRLLVSTSQLSVELTGLVQQTRGDLKPALTNLKSVVDVLRKNQSNLDNSLRLMAPFYRVFTNTLGTGPWFDTWISNLPPAPSTGVGQ
ncbi:MAG: MCE family protein [Nocardioidaceae bacterium]|nr:MCE family protein [Nocardioidaceae bacterium]